MSAPLFSIEDFTLRARSRLAPEAPSFDHARPHRNAVNDPDLMRAAMAMNRRAAVLVPVLPRPGGPQVLLTTRTEHLTSHAGQIAFPGGRLDPGDDGPRGAALREAQEEIGLGPELVTPLGFLDVFLTGTGYRIAPMVGIVDPAFVPVPNPAEVADVFEAPLSFLMAAENHAEHEVAWRGGTRRTLAMPFGERYIWGITAEILRSLYERLYGE